MIKQQHISSSLDSVGSILKKTVSTTAELYSDISLNELLSEVFQNFKENIFGNLKVGLASMWY